MGLCQVLIIRINLISSLWNGGTWGSKPQNPVFVLQWKMKINQRTILCLPPLHQSFWQTEIGSHFTTQSPTLGYHDVFSKNHLEGVLEEKDLEDFNVHETSHVNQTQIITSEKLKEGQKWAKYHSRFISPQNSVISLSHWFLTFVTVGMVEVLLILLRTQQERQILFSGKCLHTLTHTCTHRELYV